MLSNSNEFAPVFGFKFFHHFQYDYSHKVSLMTCFALDAWNILGISSFQRVNLAGMGNYGRTLVVRPAAAMADVISGGICRVVSYPV